MQNDAGFREQLTDAYEHLYDIAALRSHTLIDLVPAEPDGKERAWQLHRLLLKVVDDIAPGPNAPPSSREWRRHRLLQLRYVDAQPVQATADELAISRRQFYRVQEEAISAAADMLIEAARDNTKGAGDAAGRLDLLRSESARALNAAPTPRATHAVPAEIARKAAELLQAMCAQRSITLSVADLSGVPPLSVDPALLRQLVLGLLDYMIERTSNTSLHIAPLLPDAADAGMAGIGLRIEQPVAAQTDRIAVFDEMAEASGVRLTVSHTAHGLDRFALRAPVTRAPRVVLAVDDNADMLQLYERYLAPHGIVVHTASNAEQAFAQVQRHRPAAIFLDIMMPDQDGWDVLQQILHRPPGKPAPVIICSVLQQRDLALSLGAAGFVQKPFTPQTLLEALLPFLSN